MLIMAEILRKMPEKYFAEYDHMLIDEFQDVSYRQIEFINYSFQKAPWMKLFCVGDDWQSIYSFQDLNQSILLILKILWKGCRTYLTNYRSPSSIIDAGTLISRTGSARKPSGRENHRQKPCFTYFRQYLSYEEHID